MQENGDLQDHEKSHIDDDLADIATSTTDTKEEEEKDGVPNTILIGTKNNLKSWQQRVGCLPEGVNEHPCSTCISQKEREGNKRD